GEVQNYFYDLHDQLVKAEIFKKDGTKETWDYTYDALGRRIGKGRLKDKEVSDSLENQTRFVWDGSHLLQEVHPDGRYTYIYTDPDSYEPLAQVRNRTNEDGESKQQTHYFHCDQIGIPREMTDKDGNLLWFGNYTGWGCLKEETKVTDSAYQPFRLQNQYADLETGLHYNFFRYYEPDAGRFVNQDPIGLLGGSNLYQYASNTGLWIDSFGLKPKKKLPCIQKLRDAYPNFNVKPSARPSAEPYALNQCAIRVSYAMQKVGIDIKKLYPKTNQTSEGYARSSKGLADWIWKNYGEPQKMSVQDFQKNAKNMKGIFYELPNEGGIGHIDVIDKGAVGSGFYAAKEVWFWPMDDC
ncbi:T6SS effector amidase Tae4 family protein, partial [Neisseria sp. HMSC061E12]|uniref:T6SS effector amidase Tae4 family protein n=4 Tax=Neisseria TaxID=482 RepID=UPI000A682B31